MTDEGRSRLAPIRIGTSGWSYPSGRGTWNGIFYPGQAPPRSSKGMSAGGPDFALTPPPSPRSPRLAPRAQSFDELAYYAEHFDTVEVNSTFYRIPTPAVVAGWAKRTPPAFEFAVKLYQKFTHPMMSARDERASASPATSSDLDAFRRAIDPLASSGKLGPILAQFPPSFRMSPEAVSRLEWLLDGLGEYQVAVELRHRTWSDRMAETLGLLGRRDLTE